LDINIWLGEQKKLIDLKPFKESIFEPWTKTFTSVVPTEEYTVVPKALIKTPEFWATVQIDVGRFIYPSGTVYPKYAKVVITEPAPLPQIVPAHVSGGIRIPEHTISSGVAKSVEKGVGRVMEQASSISVMGGGKVYSQSLANVKIELLKPLKIIEDFGGASGLVYTPYGIKFAQPPSYQKISDSIFVGGGGGATQLNWAQQQQINRYLRFFELPPEEFSPFMQMPFQSPKIEPVTRIAPIAHGIPLILPREIQSSVVKSTQIQIPNLSQISSQTHASIQALHLAPLIKSAQIPAVSQVPSITAITRPIQSQKLAISQITSQLLTPIQIPIQVPISPPTFHPPYPSPPPWIPYFPPESKLKDIFIERKLPRIGTVPLERRWRLGRIEELMDQKVAFKEPRLFKDQQRKRK